MLQLFLNACIFYIDHVLEGESLADIQVLIFNVTFIRFCIFTNLCKN